MNKPWITSTSGPTVRSKIIRNRRAWARLAAFHAAYVALWSGLYAAGLIHLGGMLAGTITAGLFLTYDARYIILTTRALRTYDANPLAAYLTEIRNAFGTGSSDRS